MPKKFIIQSFRLCLALVLLAGCSGAAKKDPIPKFNKGARIRVQPHDESPSIIMYSVCMVQEGIVVGVAGRSDETVVLDRMLRFKAPDGEERACTGEMWWYKVQAGEPPATGWLMERDLAK